MPRTPEQVKAEQRAQAHRDTTRDRTPVTLPAVVPATALPTVAAVPALNSVDDYLKRNPGRMVVGRPVKPNLKLGKWIYGDDDTDAELPKDGEYICLFDTCWAGWARLVADEPVQYDGGLLFTPEFRRAPREDLGDLDPASWPLSQFDNQPQDPWKEAVFLPIEERAAGELATIQILSKSRGAALFAIDGLLGHCAQLQRRDPNVYPIIKLSIGQYESKKFGMQFKPVFKIVGKVPRSGAAQPNASSIASDMNDSLDF